MIDFQTPQSVHLDECTQFFDEQCFSLDKEI